MFGVFDKKSATEVPNTSRTPRRRNSRRRQHPRLAKCCPTRARCWHSRRVRNRLPMLVMQDVYLVDRPRTSLHEMRAARLNSGLRRRGRPMSDARWTPRNPETQTRCQNCEEPVLPGTVRVFGDNSGTLPHCGECTPIEDLGKALARIPTARSKHTRPSTSTRTTTSSPAKTRTTATTTKRTETSSTRGPIHRTGSR